MTDKNLSRQGPIIENDEEVEVREALTLTLCQSETVMGNKGQADGAITRSAASSEVDKSTTGIDDKVLKNQMQKDNDVELYEYQKELAKEGCDGANVIILAPTNSGKTYVASRIIQIHLRRQKAQEKLARVVFLVENEALAFQQGKVFAEQLAAYRTKVFTGSVQSVKGQFLRDHLAELDILVATAQILVNDLTSGKIQSLNEFSLIVFDECHHSYNDHMFNAILRNYLDMKLNSKDDAEDLPQIVGMTASLGVSGSTDDEMGINHMKRIMANMDARFLCTVRTQDNLKSLKKHMSSPKEELVAVKPRENDVFKEKVLDAAVQIEKHVNKHVAKKRRTLTDSQTATLKVPVKIIGTEQFSQWISDFKQSIAAVDATLGRILNPCREHLEAYSKSLLLHRDARTKDALHVLETFIDEFSIVPPLDEMDSTLVNIYEEMTITYQVNEDGSENPKLVRMGQILNEILVCNSNARGIIFVKTRELADALVKWINESDKLKVLNANIFVGQSVGSSSGGMTKCRQRDALECFKDGLHRVIIATSVAEEGLDIHKCNLVIRYEHVTNEIVRLQSRGRARAEHSRYFVISEEGSGILEKEKKNQRCEELMNTLVPRLQEYLENSANSWDSERRQMQLQMKKELECKVEEKRLNVIDKMEFKCLNCGSFICSSRNIKCIKGAHHIIIDPEANKRLTLQRETPYFTEPEVPIAYGGNLYCANVSCQKRLGAVCSYNDIDFPLITLKAFKVVNSNGVGKNFKRWNKVPLEIDAFTTQDLNKLTEDRLAKRIENPYYAHA